ncbi:MAG: MCE family protein [Bdellovibrionales bacterium]|nr:MCE family protein [Bdellovibrionales bacterium]
MKIKFNKFERVAGVFVLMAIIGSLVATIGIAIKKGWFQKKIAYMTNLESADGLHSGTRVQVAGLRAGSVEEVELISANEVRVKFYVFERFQKRIKKDSELSVIRPFIIGEKVLEVSVGSEAEEPLPQHSVIASKPVVDIMDLVSGKKLAPFLTSLEGILENMKTLASAFSDPRRTDAVITMFDQMNPLLENLNKMSVQVSKMSWYLNKVMPEAVKSAPEVANQMNRLVENLNVLTEELNPALKEVGPKLPYASLRALEALDEAVVVLKALQKSFLLSGKVEDVREEEAKQNKRRPASE